MPAAVAVADQAFETRDTQLVGHGVGRRLARVGHGNDDRVAIDRNRITCSGAMAASSPTGVPGCRPRIQGSEDSEMEAQAISKNIRMSARKMRPVINQIRNADVNDAYSILQFSKKGAAEPIDKALRSAVANAVDKADQQGEVLDVDDLYVKEAYVNEGPTLRRYRAAGMGRASPLRKRMSHVTVVVDTKE